MLFVMAVYVLQIPEALKYKDTLKRNARQEMNKVYLRRRNDVDP